MVQKKYKLRYLPLFYDKLTDVVNHIFSYNKRNLEELL